METINLDFTKRNTYIPNLKKGTANFYNFSFTIPDSWKGKKIAHFHSKGTDEYIPAIGGFCKLPSSMSNEKNIDVSIICIDGTTKIESNKIEMRFI